MNKLRKNVIYQMAYRILAIITPLITAPYLSRTLGANCLGIYSYTLSSVNYFVLFAMLGTETYGNREIARVSAHGNADELSQTFWEIYTLQICTSLMAIGAYLIYVIFVHENRLIALLQGIWLISTMLDINWFFFGIEQVRYTVTRNFMVKAASVVCILLFIKSEKDLILYVVIMGASVACSQIFMWIYLKKFIHYKKVKKNNIVKHLKPNLMLFIPVIGSSVYYIMDKSMLGWLSTYTELGYYYNSDKVINIPLGLITGLGTVFLSRMSKLYEAKDKDAEQALLKKSVELYTFMSAALSFGIAAVAEEFVPIFFGAGYERCILLLMFFAPIMLLKAWNDLMKYQCLLPHNQEKLYTIAVFCGAGANIIANYILINLYGALGAVLGTGVAELTICIVELYFLRNSVSIEMFASNWFYIVLAIAMLIAVRSFATQVTCATMIKLCLEILLGAGIYMVGCMAYWRLDKKSALGTMMKSAIKNVCDAHAFRQ